MSIRADKEGKPESEDILTGLYDTSKEIADRFHDCAGGTVLNRTIK